ncbi:cell division regulator GpsB [Culicoidibacter larvae]|uniref:Cell division regulator GpsB n=1 Tax=Culicoidibacter larvae TaxID=2579976 RepID=A0A5R8QFM4_9FIRM|nr:cell division regulator GpsB [Culicoidibacter larvae]TLG76594.1 cell division regulator GpsB [Culicoidibacter larvae]
MMKQVSQLSVQDILEKEFRNEIRGYSQNEVDDFLDEVIHDYEALQKEINRLTTENEELKNYLKSAQATKESASSASVASDTDAGQPAQATNYDLIRRISLLEKQMAEIIRVIRSANEE